MVQAAPGTLIVMPGIEAPSRDRSKPYLKAYTGSGKRGFLGLHHTYSCWQEKNNSKSSALLVPIKSRIASVGLNSHAGQQKFRIDVSFWPDALCFCKFVS